LFIDVKTFQSTSNITISYPIKITNNIANSSTNPETNNITYTDTNSSTIYNPTIVPTQIPTTGPTQKPSTYTSPLGTTWYYNTAITSCNIQCNNIGKYCDQYTLADMNTMTKIQSLLNQFPTITYKSIISQSDSGIGCNSQWDGPWYNPKAGTVSIGSTICIPDCSKSTATGYYKLCPCSNTLLTTPYPSKAPTTIP